MTIATPDSESRTGRRRPAEVVVVGPDGDRIVELIGPLPNTCRPRLVGTLLDVQRIRADLVVVCSPTPSRDVLRLSRVPGATRAVLVVTSTSDPYEVVESIRAGATGYLVDGQFTRADLIGAVVGALAGQHHLSESATCALVAHTSQRGLPARTVDASLLSVRQRQIMDLLSEGRSNPEIAAVLFLSEKTVRNQISAIYARIGVRDRAGAMLFWLGGPTVFRAG